MKYILNTDGGSRGNPGPAGIGMVIVNFSKGNEVVWRHGAFIGNATNNHAEYQALIAGLTKAKELGIQELECRLDSELLVKQLRKEYRVKHKDLAPLFVKAWNLAGSFARISFYHVPREENKEADACVNEALDEALKK